MNYGEGLTPDHAYRDWKENWKPPTTNIAVRRGMVLLEFGPKGHSGTMWQPDVGCGYNAKVIFDSTGELPQGCEVALEGEEGEQFNLDEREVTLVQKSAILMMMLE